MTAFKFIACLAIPAFGCSAALANEAYGDSPPDARPASTLTRAEVLADLQVWRESGLTALDFGEAGVDAFSADYRNATDRYAALRNAPEFAVRVARIARERGEVVDLAGR